MPQNPKFTDTENLKSPSNKTPNWRSILQNIGVVLALAFFAFKVYRAFNPINKESLKITAPPIAPQVAQDSVVLPPAPEETKAQTGKVIENVDQEAQFEGGISGFRNKIIGNFDTSTFEEGKAELKANISFVVNTDGSIDEVIATGDNIMFNQECVRCIRSLRLKCQPAKLNGEPVRSRFRMPMKMLFE